MEAMRDLKWLIGIVIALGIIWLVSGGPKSLTKNSATIKATSEQRASSTGGWFSFMFPGIQSGTSPNATSTTSSSKVNKGTVTYGGGGSTSGANSGATNPSGNISNRPNKNVDTKIYYGEDKLPGPLIKEPDKVTIQSVAYSSDLSGKSGKEYITIIAPSTNKEKILITGMLFKSRMTGNQVDIREGVKVYYANTVNSVEPIYLYPGEIAYVITGRSPIGYSFKVNKCIGYLNDDRQDFIVSLSSSCPRVIDYPLPARPNQFDDKCLDFLKSIGSCKTIGKIPAGLQTNCQNFAVERANYSRCVTDFSNDQNFLGADWRIYLARDDASWKTRREIIDLIDQKGNTISTFSY